MGAERSHTCGVPPFKASPSLKVLNSLLLVSSDALTPLAHYVCKLRKRIAKFQDCTNVLHSLKIGCATSRLPCNFGILRMRSTISRLRKFLDCAEHIYSHTYIHTYIHTYTHTHTLTHTHIHTHIHTHGDI